MRKYTRFLALLLALAMILSCSTSAFAENAGSADEYFKFVEEYLDAQRAAALWSPEPVLSEVSYITTSFTKPAPFMPPVSGRSNTYALMRTSLANYAVAPIADDEDPDKNNVVSSKTTTANSDGSYTVRIEAFATGTTTSIKQEKAVPTDIILVLDQSGSMADDFTSTTETTYSAYANTTSNEQYFSYATGSQNIWYQLAENEYVQVQVERTPIDSTYTAVQISNHYRNYYTTLKNYSDNNELYYKHDNGEYERVIVTSRRSNQRTYATYTLESGVVLATDIRVDNKRPTQQFYRAVISDYSYRYYYTTEAEDGTLVEHDITSSTGNSTAPLSSSAFSFYSARSTETTTTKLQSLKDAVTTFTNKVAEKAAEDQVDHRIAIVGFASQSGYGNNTEILTVSGTNSGSLGENYDDLQLSDYQSAFQDMSEEAGKTMVSNAINALAANGATRADLGMDMANKIFANDTYEIPEGETRNRVVIMFTDGQPTTQSSFSDTVANNTIDYAYDLKNTEQATVYTVGIFSGANASNPGTLPNTNNNTNKSNRYMHLTSSNYLTATSLTNTGSVNPNLNGGSYYLSAANASDLNNIFASISENIESGSTSVTLDATSKVQDIVSDFFVPIDGNTTNVTVKTAEYNGMVDGVRQWKPEQVASGVTPTVEGNNVSVTGFNFKENYVATVNNVHQGQKLIIEFDIKPKDGFLGGNDVPTNGAESGIYGADGSKAELFEVPKVNVPIVAPTVDVTDKNVYLLDDLTMAQLYPNGTIVVKDANGTQVNLDYTKLNGGLADWQIAHVDFNITLSDSAGMENLLEDDEFSASVSIAPKVTNPVSQEGTKAEATREIKDTARINVFKPVLTFKDSQVDYMSAISETGYLYNNVTKTFAADNLVSKDDSNKVKPVWKTESGVELTNQTMTGEEPTLTLAYAPTDGVDADMKVDSTTYVPMQVTVKIGDTPVTEHVTFKHTKTYPDTACEWESVTKKSKGNPAFLLHVENVNGDLKITKTVNWNGKYDEAQTFLFKVEGKKVDNSSIDPIWVSISFTYSDGKTKSETIIVEDLPAGTYTVTEIPADQRYTMSAEGNTGMVVNGTVIPEAKFTNTLINDKWLDDEYSVDNTFNDVTTQESTN